MGSAVRAAIANFARRAEGELVGVIGELWRQFVAAFRAGRQGGEALQELQDEQEIQRLGAQWGKARTPADRERAGIEAMNYIIHGPQRKSGGAPLAETNELEWSDNPGAREAYLIKRWNNPYFVPSRRSVSTEELFEAQKADGDRYLLAQSLLSGLSKEIGELPSPMTVADLHKIRTDLDELIRFAVSVGGRAKTIAVQADRIRDTVVMTIREAYSGDDEALEKIEKADTYHKDHVRKFYLPIMAEILGADRTTPDEELIPSLVSEDPATIAIVLESMPEEDRAVTQAAALKLVLEALEEGYIDSQIDEKLAVLFQ
ncbi:MAG: hypothetical protein EOR69_28510 [Mesorhizobium sp.]|nr:MAG: hypothetical protein EOR69_28510 [Mesorhizobium sp.]RWL95345.1 MAG: hypothetical protein EOR70_22510 [Mesorhizobium sp.]